MTTGRSRKGFDIDLRDGQVQEKALAHLLSGTGPRVEVKSDSKHIHTGNIFLEFEQAGPPSFVARPSGIAITVADWWATVLMDESDQPYAFVLRKTADMRRLGRLAYSEGRVKPGGDHDLYRGVTVPVDWLLRWLAPEAEQIAPPPVACGVLLDDEPCLREPAHVGPHHSENFVRMEGTAA